VKDQGALFSKSGRGVGGGGGGGGWGVFFLVGSHGRRLLSPDEKVERADEKDQPTYDTMSEAME